MDEPERSVNSWILFSSLPPFPPRYHPRARSCLVFVTRIRTGRSAAASIIGQARNNPPREHSDRGGGGVNYLKTVNSVAWREPCGDSRPECPPPLLSAQREEEEEEEAEA